MLTFKISNDSLIDSPERAMALHLIVDKLTTFDYSIDVAAYIFNSTLSSRTRRAGDVLRQFIERKYTRQDMHSAINSATIDRFDYSTIVEYEHSNVDYIEPQLTRLEAAVLKLSECSSWEWIKSTLE
jgi:hypothetical protein